MQEQHKKNSQSSPLINQSGATKSNSIEVPSISLPKGGGAIKGIDEKFSVNAVNGTASFSIPLPFAPTRGVSPALHLSYNSGNGNGIFGLGWHLDLSSIKRKTEKGLPQYFDNIDSDIFLFSGSEDLVPEFEKINGDFIKEPDGRYRISEKDSPDKLFKIRFYRPRIEGSFARIERWTEIASGIIKWRVITKDNTTTLFGWSSKSRISDPFDQTRIFEWLPEFSFDDKGNCTRYIYKEDDVQGLIDTPHNNNRIVNGKPTYANLYIEKIVYGNKTPYKHFGDLFPADEDFLFVTAFDYGTCSENDSPEVINTWDFRTDAFSDYKAGFEIRTTRLCKRVVLFHRFDGPNEYNGLVRSQNFEYDTTTQRDFTFLKSISSCGYIKKPDGTYSRKGLPPTEFEYQKHEWSKEVKDISPADLINAPVGLTGQYQFTDLFNEGLAGILTEQAGGWYYKHNLSNGRFENAKLVSPKPNFIGLNEQLQLADLDANGGKQLVSYSRGLKGYFELNDDGEWQSFKHFQAAPNIDLKDTNTRIIDLNGDGKAEILISENAVFTWYESAGKNGFTDYHRITKPEDEEEGPAIIFADRTQSIFLADMSGDGLIDIVRIRNGDVCYWPNLGYGKFGAKISMDNAPLFDLPGSFNPSFIKLADIDGSGTTDIIYLGKNKFSCWTNLSGNSFTITPFQIDAFPAIDNQAEVTITDLLGNGVASIVWSSSLQKDKVPLKYIDIMNSKKPHIMTGYKNNMGKEVSMQYRPSTHFYIEDKLSGRPWVTKLHFPVHCISKTETRDKISGHRFISEYKYHHGYYDHTEKEFRGFGMVEQTDTEDFELWRLTEATNMVDDISLHQKPVLVKTWTHTGAFLENDKIPDQFAHEYWSEEMKRQGFTVISPEHDLPAARIIDEEGNDLIASNQLSPQDWQEAWRACKGMMLRSEVFAKDASTENPQGVELQKVITPYSVATHNCVIVRLQPKGQNKYGIFIVKESEAITYNYERDIKDPRISHTLNIKLDTYGNVLEAASVVYPRKIKITTLPQATQQAQDETCILYSDNSYTNDINVKLEVNKPDAYRLRLSSEIKTWQLKGVKKNIRSNPFYSLSDFTDILNKSKEVLYHELDRQPDDTVPPASYKPLKRLIEHIRSNYYNNDLSGPLPLNQMQSLGLTYESYQLAYTPDLVTNIYGTKVDAAVLTEGKFTHSENDMNWWVRSGTTLFIEGAETSTDALSRFYLPIVYTDPFGATTKVAYGNYYLYIRETTDALLNVSGVTKFNYRTLSAAQMKDMNDNLSEAITDELGLVKATAAMGKDLNNDGAGDEADNPAGLEEITVNEQADIRSFFQIANAPGICQSDDLRIKAGDLLKNATSRFIYDFDCYKEEGRPVVAASIIREEHFTKNPGSPIQLAFEYSNGQGKVIMKKVQAEPGKAKQVVIDANGATNIIGTDTSALNPTRLRWIGNGRTILNNKGNPVKQYEPFYSVSPKFENEKELVETGVTPIMYYDALSRLIKTEMPDGTFSKVEFDSWQQTLYDANDTVKDSEWYNKRKLLLQNDPARIAADKTEAHYDTPTQIHFDTLGKPVLQIENSGRDAAGNYIYLKTKVELDIEGNVRKVTDARELPENGNTGNVVMQYRYDMLGNKVYQHSMDAGQRWLLMNCIGNPLRTWDERDHEFRYNYDILHRPTESIVINQTGKPGDRILNNIIGRTLYGESEPDAKLKNMRGKPICVYDTGGLQEIPGYDFKGQPTSTTRKLFKKYKEVANWTETNLQADLENESFTFITETDALGRITRQTAPDGSIITPSYNEAGLLNSETAVHPNPALTTVYIKDIDYNEKGQRNKIIYGNDVITRFYYDEKTFRLNRLETKRQNNDPLQDWYYTFDPVGNITQIEDKNIPVVFFNNQKTTGVSTYTYDALYRLIEATGKENNTGLALTNEDNWNDATFKSQLSPDDPIAMRNYTQNYQYDQVGNIQQMKHIATGNSWTREYAYETNNNRLKATQIGTEIFTYTHHPRHGFITLMSHLQEMGWNFKEELSKTIRQKRTDGGTPETTYYQYDGQGQRIRKITESAADAGIVPTKKEERIYLASFELYKKYYGPDSGLERSTLSLMDEGHRFVMIETRNEIDDGTEKRLIRYQLVNHLGSVAMELNDQAQVISYEEHHPYGTTACQVKNKTIQCAAKRYRYTGMERDEETGLAYHSARYYLPWLGRWCNCDPKGLIDSVNVFSYCTNNPVYFNDKTGTENSETSVVTPAVREVFNTYGVKYEEQVMAKVYNSKTKEWIPAVFDVVGIDPRTNLPFIPELKGLKPDKLHGNQSEYLPILESLEGGLIKFEGKNAKALGLAGTQLEVNSKTYFRVFMGGFDHKKAFGIEAFKDAIKTMTGGEKIIHSFFIDGKWKFFKASETDAAKKFMKEIGAADYVSASDAKKALTGTTNKAKSASAVEKAAAVESGNRMQEYGTLTGEAPEQAKVAGELSNPVKKLYGGAIGGMQGKTDDPNKKTTAVKKGFIKEEPVEEPGFFDGLFGESAEEKAKREKEEILKKLKEKNALESSYQ
jgi:RHS repeat-associated protein